MVSPGERDVIRPAPLEQTAFLVSSARDRKAKADTVASTHFHSSACCSRAVRLSVSRFMG